MRDVILARDDGEIEAVLAKVETEKDDIHRQLGIISDHYLGPADDIKNLAEEMARWSAYHDETIRRIRAQEREAAIDRTRNGNAEGGETFRLMACIKTLDGFARKTGEELYREARLRTEALSRQLLFIVLGIVLLTFSVYWRLLRNLKTPLVQLTALADDFRRGRLNVRSGYVSANEFGDLSAAFNAMAETVETQRLINEQAAQLTGIMLREADSHGFFRELIRELAGQTGSQVGGVYLRESSKDRIRAF